MKTKIHNNKNGDKIHYNLKGQIHNIKGPSIESNNGQKEYWICNWKYSNFLEYICSIKRYKILNKT